MNLVIIDIKYKFKIYSSLGQVYSYNDRLPVVDHYH